MIGNASMFEFRMVKWWTFCVIVIVIIIAAVLYEWGLNEGNSIGENLNASKRAQERNKQTRQTHTHTRWIVIIIGKSTNWVKATMILKHIHLEL